MRVSDGLLHVLGIRLESLIIGEVAVVYAALSVACENFAIGGFDVDDAETQQFNLGQVLGQRNAHEVRTPLYRVDVVRNQHTPIIQNSKLGVTNRKVRSASDVKNPVELVIYVVKRYGELGARNFTLLNTDSKLPEQSGTESVDFVIFVEKNCMGISTLNRFEVNLFWHLFAEADQAVGDVEDVHALLSDLSKHMERTVFEQE